MNSSFAAYDEFLQRFGDSLTQEGFKVGGWAARLADRYSRRLDVICRGFSGYNTKWAYDLLPHMSLPKSPELVTVFFGANDAALKEKNPAQHVPLEEYQKNLQAIVTYMKETLGAKNVIVISPPAVIESAWRDTMRAKSGDEDVESDRRNAMTGQYAEAAREAAKSTSAGFVDTFGAIEKSENKASLYTDGLHLSAEGNKVIYDLIIAYIDEHVSSLKVSPCKFSGSINSGSVSEITQLAPWWDQVDPKDFEGSLRKAVDEKRE